MPPPPGARNGSICASRRAPSDRADISWLGPYGRARARAIELLLPSALSRYRRCLEEVPPPPLTLSPPPQVTRTSSRAWATILRPAPAPVARRAPPAAVPWRSATSCLGGAGWGVHFGPHFQPHLLVWKSLKVIPGANPVSVTSRVRCAHVRSLCVCSVCSDFRVTAYSRAGLEASREPRVGSGARQRLCRPCF